MNHYSGNGAVIQQIRLFVMRRQISKKISAPETDNDEVTLLLAQTRSFESFVVRSDLRFRAAVAFNPPCRWAGSRPGIPTLILVGALDDWTPSEDCSRKVAGWGTEGPPVELVVYPGVHHGFYYPHLQPGRRLFGHWVEYNGDAADDASVQMQQFLQRHLN